MKKLLLAIASTTTSLFVLLPVNHSQAASLGLTVTENSTDNTTPAPEVSDLVLFKNLVSAQGQVTSIDGFSSLQGVDPNNLTLNFGNLTLLSSANKDRIISTFFGNDGSKTPYFNLLENGQVIATSNNVQIAGSVNDVVGSPDYAKGTQDIKITLNGVIGSPFFQEIQQITNGTGILDINLGTPTAIGSPTPISPDASGSFTFTGGTLVASTPNQNQNPTPTPARVPEPSEVGGLLVMGAGCLLRKKGERKISGEIGGLTLPL